MLLPIRLALALFGGLAIWVAFPNVGLWWSAPIGVAMLVAATRGGRVRSGFVFGSLGGLAWFIPYVSWTGLHVGATPWLALATLQALFIGLFGALVALAHRNGRRVNPLLVAALWSATEWARGSTPFGGFPWGRIAFSQADGPLLNLAALGGASLLGFAVALVGSLLLSAVDAARHRTARPAALAAGLAALLLLAPLAIPTPTEGDGATDGRGGATATFMAVQGNAPRAGLDFNASRRQILDNHGRVTIEAAGRVRSGELPTPDLVVWPENASDIDPFVNPDAGRVIDTAVSAIDAPVLVGAVLGGGRSDLTNTSILYVPGEGATDQRYSKRELVPFGEYMPHRAFFRAITRQVDLLERDFVPGNTPGVIQVPTQRGPVIKAGLGICFEVAIDHVLQDTIDAGANVLVIQTNNAMFDLSAESAQQLAISRVRAVEYGRSVVHSSNVGITALITPDGVAHQETGLFTPAIVTGDLPLRTERTIATRLGAWPDRLIALGAALALATSLRRKRENPRS